MKAEVRVGNWVKYGNPNATVVIPDRIGQVKGITIFGELDFSTPQIEHKVPAKHCMGIELSPEILEKAGFVLDASYQVPQWQHQSGFYFHDKYVIDCYSIHLMNAFDVEFNYVHQLQNFFYQITGSELPLNL